VALPCNTEIVYTTPKFPVSVAGPFMVTTSGLLLLFVLPLKLTKLFPPVGVAVTVT
jgi:hypothetical protein